MTRAPDRPDADRITELLAANSALVQRARTAEKVVDALTAGRIYLHYKGGLYRYLFDGLDSTTGERVSVYQCLASNKGDPAHVGQVWVRPKTEFFEKLPDGTPRFAPLTI